MFKKSIFLAIFSILLTLPLFNASAQTIDIILNQQTFKPGETIEAKVSFTNPTQQQLKGYLMCNFAALNPGLPPAPFQEEFNLAPKEKSKTFAFEMSVGEWMPEGLWKAEVEIKDERENLVAKSYKEFAVTGTKKFIQADATVCVDKDCNERKTVFIKGETVYLKLNTLIQDLNIDATLKIPGGKIEKIIFENNFASYSLKDADEGSYSLWVNISKDGYQNQKITKDFAVLNKPAEIPSASICNADGKCAGKEDKQNCPQDCLPKTTKDSNLYIFTIAALLVAATGIIIFILKRKKRGNLTELEK